MVDLTLVTLIEAVFFEAINNTLFVHIFVFVLVFLYPKTLHNASSFNFNS